MNIVQLILHLIWISKLTNCTLHPKIPLRNNPAVTRRSSIAGLRKLRVQLSEEEPEGREVANLRFLVDGWSEQGKPASNQSTTSTYNFQIFNSEPQSSFFHLDPTSGRLRIAKRIDRDQLCPIVHSCCPRTAEDIYPIDTSPRKSDSNENYPDSPSEDSTAKYLPDCRLDLNVRSDDQYSKIILVHVHIVDINDNSPIWPHVTESADVANGNDQEHTLIFHMSENSLIGDSISLTIAYDADTGLNGIVRYTLTPELPEFRLKWTSDNDFSSRSVTDDDQSYNPRETQFTQVLGARHELRLMVRELLDRERRSVYDLTLTAFDGGSPSRNASIPLRVIVTDANDNSPKFEKDTYTVEVMENSKPHTPVVQVTATDADEGVNSRIKYRFSSLTKPEFMRLFTLDAITGWIHVQWEIDYEIHKKILLTVEAVDGGQLPRASTCVVELLVLDENDHAPEIRFEPAFVTNYALVPENENPPGRLVAVFTVTDRDAGENGRVSCQLTEPNHWRFQSNNPTTVEAMLAANPLNMFFKLQHMQVPFSVMYKLTTASIFDREITSQISVLIVCSDYGQPPRNTSGSVAVRITDENDVKPKFLRERFYLSVQEDASVGSNLFTINATDDDEGMNAKLTYWLSGPDANYFTVNENTGELSVRRPLDRELKSSLHCRVHARDNGTPSLNGSADVLITVTDINDNPPVITERVEFEILENHTSSIPVGRLTVTDRDSGRNAEVSFSLVQCLAHQLEASTSKTDISERGHQTGNWSNQIEAPYTFFIANDGRIFLGHAKLDRETTPVYDLTVLAEDHGQPRLTATTTVIIRILDVNDNAPTFIFPSTGNNTVYVPRSIEPGLPVATVHAVDRDSDDNGRVTYTLKADRLGVHQDLFSLNSQSGELHLKRYLDRTTSFAGSLSNFSQSAKVTVVTQDQPDLVKDNSDTYSQQSAFSLLITASDHGNPPLKSSTILRILFTPPFYPPLDRQVPQTKRVSNWKPINSLTENAGAKRPFSILSFGSSEFEDDLTGFGILLGLVLAIGLFICFVILTVAVLLRHVRSLRHRRTSHTPDSVHQDHRLPDPSIQKTVRERALSRFKGNSTYGQFVQFPIALDTSTASIPLAPTTGIPCTTTNNTRSV